METAGKHLESLGFRIVKDSADERILRLNRPKGGWVDVSWIVTLRGETGKLRDVTVKVAYTGP